MSAVEASDLLHAFVRGLRKDLPAVVAGLSLPYSNRPIEGANTKVKLLKPADVRAGELPSAAKRDPAQLTPPTPALLCQSRSSDSPRYGRRCNPSRRSPVR
jgi:hypothetical protein